MFEKNLANDARVFALLFEVYDFGLFYLIIIVFRKPAYIFLLF